MNKLIFLGLIPVLMLTVPNVSATGIRHDTAEDATDEEAECWINGYDSGFAGKYDRDRALECIEYDDSYNFTWTRGCEDSLRTEEECGELLNNPVEIEDYEILEAQNNQTCRDAGFEDGENNRPFNEERDDGCYEFEGVQSYEEAYQLGCEEHTTESTCELKYEEKKYYCPNHPDVGGCTEFLHNATNKEPREVSASTNCLNVNVTCMHEFNPEGYCLKYNDPEFCNTIGDICDADGFVRPEYPYCKGDEQYQDVGFKSNCYDRNDNPSEYCDKYAEEEANKEWIAWFCEAVCNNYDGVLAKGEHCDNTIEH